MTSPHISSLPPESVLEEVSSQQAASQNPPPTPVSASAPAPSRAVSFPVDPPPPVAASFPVSQQEELTIQGKYLLRVRTTQKVRLRVVVGDHQATQVLLEPGDGRTWHIQEGFIVTVGNAGGVEFTLDY